MSKPTIFFSHSSKDKEIVLSVKNKLDKATGGVMDIFMSSDGQSIPFGTNWIHKVEEGLKSATIMFVFVTENSISSGWIYFEAGYAYSKGIQVIPVGIGVDIGSLKAPLNLLQGFNILSEDSLNNFITIINRTFDYHFESPFSYSDYLEVVRHLSLESINAVNFEEIIAKAECEVFGEKTVNGETIRTDIAKIFDDIIGFLDTNHIPFSRNDKYHDERNICLVANGIKIIYRKEKTERKQNYNLYEDCAKLSFSVSPINFSKAFTLLKSILQLLEDNETSYLKFHLKEEYNYITKVEDGSSIISNYSEFDVDKSYVGGYIYDDLGLKFYVFDNNSPYERNYKPDFVASVVFDRKKIRAENIIKLVDKLYEIGFIFEHE